MSRVLRLAHGVILFAPIAVLVVVTPFALVYQGLAMLLDWHPIILPSATGGLVLVWLGLWLLWLLVELLVGELE